MNAMDDAKWPFDLTDFEYSYADERDWQSEQKPTKGAENQLPGTHSKRHEKAGYQTSSNHLQIWTLNLGNTARKGWDKRSDAPLHQYVLHSTAHILVMQECSNHIASGLDQQLRQEGWIVSYSGPGFYNGVAVRMAVSETSVALLHSNDPSHGAFSFAIWEINFGRDVTNYPVTRSAMTCMRVASVHVHHNAAKNKCSAMRKCYRQFLFLCSVLEVDYVGGDFNQFMSRYQAQKNRGEHQQHKSNVAFVIIQTASLNIFRTTSHEQR